jgi:DNA-binding MarR family transcriptional regulator
MNQAIHISRSILKLTRLYKLALYHIFKDYKLTKPQMLIIAQIRKDPRTIGQITEAVELSYSTVSGIIDRLERDEWIQRVRDKSDRRVIWIQKTDKLEEICNTLDFYQEELFQTLLGDLSAEQLDGIVVCLDQLNSHLEKKSSDNPDIISNLFSK